MPAPIEIVTAYARAQRDAHTASVMKKLEIDHTIQFWATASDSAKNVAMSFFRSSESQSN